MSQSEPNPYEPAKPFESYSQDIRDAFSQANREAISLSATRIKPSHLLIAIAHEPTGLGGALLRQYGVTAKSVRKEVIKQNSEAECITIGRLPLSNRSKLLIESATKYAIENKHTCVGTGHILLAMLMTEEPATALLTSLGVDLQALANDLIGQLS